MKNGFWGSLPFLGVMKAESKKFSQGNVLHQGYEGRKWEIELVKSPSSGL